MRDISTHSIPSSFLDEFVHLSDLILTLCHLMYKCPFKEVVSVLITLVQTVNILFVVLEEAIS